MGQNIWALKQNVCNIFFFSVYILLPLVYSISEVSPVIPLIDYLTSLVFFSFYFYISATYSFQYFEISPVIPLNNYLTLFCRYLVSKWQSIRGIKDGMEWIWEE